jgi:hypothetical protein
LGFSTLFDMHLMAHCLPEKVWNSRTVILIYTDEHTTRYDQPTLCFHQKRRRQMRTNPFFLIGLFAIGLFVLSGCYTQVAKPDPDEDQAVTEESEQAESEEQAQEESYTSPHRTNIYVYGAYGYPYYYDPFWYDPFWSPYYPWRSSFYVYIGYSYYDPWDWCGTPWYYYPRHCGYYGRHAWWPSYYDYYYYPRYYHGGYYGRSYEKDDRSPVRQRSIDRRTRSTDLTPVAFGTTRKYSRPSLSKIRPVVYTRDASGALQRRTRGDAVGAPKTIIGGRDAMPPVKRNDGGDRRVSKGNANDTPSDGAPGYVTTRKQSPPSSSGGSGETRTRKQRPSPAPPVSKGGSSSPPAKRSSGGSVSKPPSSGSSGNSGSSNKGSGSSGSSNRRTRRP